MSATLAIGPGATGIGAFCAACEGCPAERDDLNCGNLLPGAPAPCAHHTSAITIANTAAPPIHRCERRRFSGGFSSAIVFGLSGLRTGLSGTPGIFGVVAFIDFVLFGSFGICLMRPFHAHRVVRDVVLQIRQ